MEGSPRGLPKSQPSSGGGGGGEPTPELPDGWVIVEPILVTGGTRTYAGGAGTTALSTTGVQAGDLMVVGIGTRNSAVTDPVPSTGAAWTTIFDTDVGSDEWTSLWAKIANGTEDATVGIGMSAGDNAAALAIIRKGNGEPFTTFSSQVNIDWATGSASAPAISALAGDIFIGGTLGAVNSGAASPRGYAAVHSNDGSDCWIDMIVMPVVKDMTYPHLFVPNWGSGFSSGFAIVAR